MFFENRTPFAHLHAEEIRANIEEVYVGREVVTNLMADYNTSTIFFSPPGDGQTTETIKWSSTLNKAKKILAIRSTDLIYSHLTYKLRLDQKPLLHQLAETILKDVIVANPHRFIKLPLDRQISWWRLLKEIAPKLNPYGIINRDLQLKKSYGAALHGHLCSSIIGTEDLHQILFSLCGILKEDFLITQLVLIFDAQCTADEKFHTYENGTLIDLVNYSQVFNFPSNFIWRVFLPLKCESSVLNSLISQSARVKLEYLNWDSPISFSNPHSGENQIDPLEKLLRNRILWATEDENILDLKQLYHQLDGAEHLMKDFIGLVRLHKSYFAPNAIGTPKVLILIGQLLDQFVSQEKQSTLKVNENKTWSKFCDFVAQEMKVYETNFILGEYTAMSTNTYKEILAAIWLITLPVLQDAGKDALSWLSNELKETILDWFGRLGLDRTSNEDIDSISIKLAEYPDFDLEQMKFEVETKRALGKVIKDFDYTELSLLYMEIEGYMSTNLSFHDRFRNQDNFSIGTSIITWCDKNNKLDLCLKFVIKHKFNVTL